MHPLAVALNPSPQTPEEDAPVSHSDPNSFQFIQGEPTSGLAGIYIMIGCGLLISQYVLS